MATLALVAALLWPCAVPFLQSQQSSEASLPACCRRDGKHHCAMTANVMAGSEETQFKSAPESCPFRQDARAVAHLALAFAPPAQSFFAGLSSHPAIHEQTLAHLRTSECRSHQKRGPPLLA
jgi:hypothetical protein